MASQSGMRVLSLGLSVPKIRFCNNGDDLRSGRVQSAALLEEIVGPQPHRSFSVDWPFEELTRCSLLNRIAQPPRPAAILMRKINIWIVLAILLALLAITRYLRDERDIRLELEQSTASLCGRRRTDENGFG